MPIPSYREHININVLRNFLDSPGEVVDYAFQLRRLPSYEVAWELKFWEVEADEITSDEFEGFADIARVVLTEGTGETSAEVERRLDLMLARVGAAEAVTVAMVEGRPLVVVIKDLLFSGLTEA